MKQENEFLRSDPKRRNRKLIYDITNLIIPVLIIIIGIFLSTQKFAEMMGYNPRYCQEPIYILKHGIGKYPVGYPIFNPIVILVTMFTNPFDPLVQDSIGQAAIPGIICAIISIFTWALISIIRTSGLNKNDKAQASSRWGNKKDLKKFGLTEKKGVVLAQQWEAKTEAIINKKGNFGLKIHKTSPLICHSGTNHTMMIAPTRAGKGTGSIIQTCVTYEESMIIFDPKGELYNMTAGYRSKFSHVIKFSPVQMETACFNPLEEIELNENAFRDVGTILQNIFQQSDKADSNAAFFDNNARDLLTGVIFHVLSAVDDNGEKKYSAEERTIAGVLRIFARAANGQNEDGEPLPAGEALLDEMIASRHLDDKGNESDYIHGIILDVAMSAKQQHEKVRADIMQTIQSKLNLFRDPFIRHVTSHSDFKISDFYDSKEPVTLYLTLPFGDIDRIMSVFQLIIDFILRRFSSGELKAGEKEKTLKHPILFLLDEFPTLGKMKFLATSMGVLAGYGLRFYIIVQTYQQIVQIYGNENAFIDNCRYIVIYAPNNIKDAEMFSKMIGKKSITKDNLSVSGSRFSVALNNLNTSSQEMSVDLINPDELMKMPYTDCIILAHNMPAYMGKKLAFYDDDRFKWKVYFENVDTDTVETGFKAPYKQEEINEECRGLPSQIKKIKEIKVDKEKIEEKKEHAQNEEERKKFSPVDYLESYKKEDSKVEDWDSPFDSKLEDGEQLPTTASYDVDDFNNQGVEIENITKEEMKEVN